MAIKFEKTQVKGGFPVFWRGEREVLPGDFAVKGTYPEGTILKEGTPIKLDFENMECTIYSYKGKVFNVEPPFFVELEVTETDPGFAGNTATNATKPATVETGAEIKVPLFIEPGEKIKIDTRTGEYLSRA